MNGIISYDDGDGGSMSGGVITANTLATKNISSNSLEPFDTSTNYNLYTTAVNDIYLGNAGIVCYTAAPISSTNTIVASQFNAPNGYLTQLDSNLINTSTLNASTINVSTLSIGTTSFGTINCSTINASTGNIANFNFSNNTMKLNVSGNMSIGTSNVNKLYLGNASSLLTQGVVCNKIICETTQFDLCSDLTALSPSTTVNIGLNASIVAIGSGNSYGIDISELRIRTGSIITTTSPTYPLTLGGINMSANTRVFLGAGQNVVELGTNNAGCTTRVGSWMSQTTGLTSSLDAVDIYGNPSATQTTNISPVLTTGTFNLTSGLTTGTLNLANNLTTGITNICNSNAFRGTINIGATANASTLLTNTINIGSSTTTALNINAPLTPNYNSKYNATTGSPSGCIGFQIYGTITGGSSFSTSLGNVAATIGSIALSIGVWVITFVAQFSNTSTTTAANFTFISLRVGTTTNGTDVYLKSFFGGGALQKAGVKGDAQNIPFTLIYNATTAQTLSFSTRAQSTGVTSININVGGTIDDGPAEIRAIRIA